MAKVLDRDDVELRLQCVDLALRQNCHTLSTARQIYDFVTGASDATPAEKLRDALAENGVNLSA